MKNPNGYGSIYKNSGKRRKPFVVLITTGWDNNAKQIREPLGYYETRILANIALAEYNKNKYNIVDAKASFSQIYLDWANEKWKKDKLDSGEISLEDIKLSKSSIENYTNAYNNYCKELYTRTFRELRVYDFQNIIDECGMNYPTRKVIKTLFSQMSDFAIKHDIQNKNHAKFVDIGEKEGVSNRKPFEKEEIAWLFEHIKNTDSVDTVLILIFTGLRIGELLSIEISNVNLEDKYMTGGSKTAAGKNRIIPIADKIFHLVKARYDYAVENNCKYLIVNFQNEQMKYSNFKREKFDTIMQLLGTDHNPHDTRHTTATLLDRAGANKLSIKRILGHAIQDLTGEVYIHKTIEDLIEAINLIEKVLV